MILLRLVCVVVILSQYVEAVSSGGLLVNTKVGLIRGKAATDGDYNMFLGIPYAKVDETNPFGPSDPYPNFEDTFESFDDSAACPQISEFNENKIIGTLECLHLNVYIPTAASSSNLPVLVWIHGGKFKSGTSGRIVYGPKFLVRHNVILVTLNYRLGPYGFICLDTPAAPGNQGLKDQRIALEWVRENIEAFGGDVSKITIFGESAGAVAVDFHVRLDQDDLFNQAILLSGTSQNPRGYKKVSNNTALQLSEHLGFATNNVIHALTFLASVNSSLVISSTQELDLEFGPCVENKFDDVESFLTDYPINLRAKKIPLLFGFNSDECVISYNEYNAEYFAKHDYLRENINNDFSVNNQTSAEMSQKIRNFYFDGRVLSEETKRRVLNFCLDYRYVYPALRNLRKFIDSGAEDLFTYMFSYVGQRNYIKYLRNITYGGAAHGDGLSYLWDVSFLKNIDPKEDQTIIDRMTAMWTNFAKYGNPTPETSELLPVSWVPATRYQWNYLNINSKLTAETHPFHDRMAFLDKFYKMYAKYLTGYREYDCMGSIF